MKFTELLKDWMDARETYNEACKSPKYDTFHLDDMEMIMIGCENKINYVIERLEAICDNRLL